MQMVPHHQNTMRALRREMGFPNYDPVNNSLAFTSGKDLSLQVGLEIGRVAEMLNKDLIYSGWANTKAQSPTSFAVAYRGLLSVDILKNVVPHAANDTAPIVLVSTRSDEVFALDQRGSLVRVNGKPRDIRKGRQLAMQRIKSTMATMGDTLLSSNRFVPTGQDWVEPDAGASETLVRFR